MVDGSGDTAGHQARPPDTTTATSARFVVSGRVQGVHFRACTAREAARLGLDGHAINRPDGSVDVLARGPVEAVDALGSWLQRGSPLSRVDSVQRMRSNEIPARGFTTG